MLLIWLVKELNIDHSGVFVLELFWAFLILPANMFFVIF